MTNSEARKRKAGEPPSEHAQVAREIGDDISTWLKKNQSSLRKMNKGDAVAAVVYGIGVIVGEHSQR